MAKSHSADAVFFVLLLATAIFDVEANLCERRSKTWTGPCLNSDHCNDQCIHRENAKSGACHPVFPDGACVCYFDYVEADLCGRPSKAWSGACINSDHCNDQCILHREENAKGGGCIILFPWLPCSCSDCQRREQAL